MKGYLIRPRDWQLIAQREAAALLGTPEGAAKLAEAKRYEVLADKIDRLEAAVQLCDKHKPNGGTRSCCVICSGEALSAALSQISYLCSEPNEMGVSPYDAHFDEEAVVDQVRHALKDLAPERGNSGVRPPGDGKRRLARSKAARAAQGYDDKPPRCGECVSFVPCGHKRGGRWQPPTCAIGGFAVQSFGICDRWQGANGDTLEK